MRKYRFAYSGEVYEGVKDFDILSDLRKFLKIVPPYELQNSISIKNKKGIAYVGQYVRDKRMIIF